MFIFTIKVDKIKNRGEILYERKNTIHIRKSLQKDIFKKIEVKELKKNYLF